jgi:biotin-(acetyl-CoA carboxylase) ligase
MIIDHSRCAAVRLCRPLLSMTSTPRSYHCNFKSRFIILAFVVFASKGGGLGGVGGVLGRYVNKGPSRSAFVMAVHPSASSASAMSSSSESTIDECSTLLPSKVMMHHQDPNLWLYHVEATTSTMDEARKIVESITANTDESKPKSFLISAASQSRGRGTTQRNWKSAQRGNALFTIGIPQSSWMVDLKKKNHGTMVPLTLLPLKVGSLVAQRIQRSLEECIDNNLQGMDKSPPKVTVKWPNDVLLKQSSSTQSSSEKVAGILIESAKDWFIIGIGINVGYAPVIPKEGADYGREATCLSQYCNAVAAAADDDDNEEYWVEVSKKLAKDIAYDLHSWLHSDQQDDYLLSSTDEHSGGAILDKWKSFLDWEMELILRDTPKRERVTLTDVMEDGRVIVKEVQTGITRTLVADYFL